MSWWTDFWGPPSKPPFTSGDKVKHKLNGYTMMVVGDRYEGNCNWGWSVWVCRYWDGHKFQVETFTTEELEHET